MGFKTIAILVFLVAGGFLQGQTEKMASITGGTYVPLYGQDSIMVTVPDFKMDVYPVTNQQFLDFVKTRPQWQKSRVKRLFADENYLSNWLGDTLLGIHQSKNSPVTQVSWFAAKAYCECLDKRLPTIDEWEYVAMSDAYVADARKKTSYNQFILGWYETPRTSRQEIGSTFKNFWGVYDLHGLVWEWTSDFNSVLISGESRKDGNGDSTLFCGTAAIGATDLMNYAAFMRYAFRGSIKANYAMKNLGFRCVKDIGENES